MFRVRCHGRLAHLDHEALRREAVLLERRLHRRRKIPIHDLPVGEVDRDGKGHGLWILAPPFRELLAHFVQHPPADEHDEPGLLHVVHELTRGQQAAGRVLPAHQGFKAAEPPFFHVEDRLIGHAELAAPQRERELRLHADTAHCLAVHVLIVHHRACAAPPLGVVHRRVRIAQQVARLGCTIAAHAHADAERREDVPARQWHERAHRVVHLVRETQYLGFARHAIQQYHELVAAHARQQVVGAEDAPDAIDGLAQQGVAGGVPKPVVHLLEPVEVEVEHRECGIRRSCGACDARGQPLGQRHTVWQRREGIAPCIVAQLHLGALAEVDVHERTGELRERPVSVPERPQAHEHPAHVALHGDDAQLHVGSRQFGAHDLGNRPLERRNIRRVHMPLHVRGIRQRFALGVPQQLERTRREADFVTLDVEVPESLHRRRRRDFPRDVLAGKADGRNSRSRS